MVTTDAVLKELAAGVDSTTLGFILTDIRDKTSPEIDLARYYFARELTIRRAPKPKKCAEDGQPKYEGRMIFPDESGSVTSKKGRGRPRGSKNRVE